MPDHAIQMRAMLAYSAMQHTHGFNNEVSKQSMLGAVSSHGICHILPDYFPSQYVCCYIRLHSNVCLQITVNLYPASPQTSAWLPGLTFDCVHTGPSCKWLAAAHSGGHHSAEDSGQGARPRASLHLGVCTSALHTLITHHAFLSPGSGKP